MDEPLAILLLPCGLDGFELADHARDLLSIPRVIALEPSRVRPPRFLRESVPVRQARRLRFPGVPRVLVLYHPAQYPLARALLARHEQAELWHVDSGRGPAWADDDPRLDELAALDALSRQRAAEAFVLGDGDPRAVNEAVRRRLHELEIISPRPFVPGARIVGH